MTILKRLRDTVVTVSNCCFEETFVNDADDYDDDGYDNEKEWYRTLEPAIFELFDPIVTMSLRVCDVRSPSSTPVIKRKKSSQKSTIMRKKSGVTNSSAETAVSACVHMKKSINFDAMKKGLQQQVFGKCAGCAFDVLRSSNNDQVCNDITEEDTGSDNLIYMSETTTTTIYVCLQCGCQGCGIKSRRRHALRHVTAAGATTHALVMNTTTWMVWCLECKVEIPVLQSMRLVQCVKHLRKLARVSIGRSLKSCCASLTRKFISWIGDVYTACSCKASVEVENQVATYTALVPSAFVNVDSSKERMGPSSQKVLGLRNVGNTCYFNAAMQALIQTYNLVKLLMERSIEGGPLLLPGRKYISDNSRTCSNDEDDYNLELPSITINLSQARPVTMALANFLLKINSATQTNVVNPRALFGQVCNEAPMFRGNEQHDSHELLSHMLGIMRAEEVKRRQVAVLKYFELSVNSDPQKVDHDLKMKVRNYGHQVNYTFVDALFGGCLVSTVMCEECHYISQTVEPFQDLSLPVQEEKTCGIASLYNYVLVEGKKKGEEEKRDMVANIKEDIIHVDQKEEEDGKAYAKDMIAVEREMDLKEEKGDREANKKENIHLVEVEKEGDEEGDMVDDVIMEDMVPVEGEIVGKDENVKNSMIPLEVEKEGKVEKDMKGYMQEEMVLGEWEKVAREEADVEEDMVPVEVEKEKESRLDKKDSEEDVKEYMATVVTEKDVDVEKEVEMEVDVMEDMVPVKWEKEIEEEEGDKEEDVKEEMVHAKVESEGKDEVNNKMNVNEEIFPLQREYESKEEECNINKDVMEDLVSVEWEKECEEEKGFIEDAMWVDIVPVVLEYVGEEEKGDREEDVKNYLVSVEGEMEKGDMEEDLKEEIVPAEGKKEGKEFGDRDEDMKAYIVPMEVEIEVDWEEDTREDIVHVDSEYEGKEEKQDMDESVKDMVSHELEKESKGEGGDMMEDLEDTKDFKEEKSGVAVWETEDGSSKESHSANGQMHESQVTVHVEYMNGPVANGYRESGVTSSEEPIELESATSSILLSSSSYKYLGIGEQDISDVTSGTNTSSVIGTCSSGFSQDLSLIMLYQSSEESEKVKDLDVPVNSSESTVSDDTGISTQGTGSTDSATVGNNEIPLKAGHDEDKSSLNVQHMKPPEFEDPQPVRSCKEIWKEGQRKSVSTLAPRYHSTSGECSIESCLNLFTASELLTGSNKFGCKNCTKLKKKLSPNAEIKTVYSDATKKYLIIQPPAVLTLHLKRFEQFQITKINKLDRHVDFPFVLDLAPYCSALCENVKPGQKKILYSLYGVVEHQGDLRYGHYTAYVKVRPSITSLTNFLNTHHASVKEYLNQYTDNVLRMGDNMEKETKEDNIDEILVPPGQWFRISDTQVSKVTEATVKYAQAYMLFYERIF
ncbi:hypothetical protein ACJMK2_018178 [Sinanodonta woodiana]|uniref:ubiquitinyl hydrolase 1 n=1 Tax=Sinanodonta woodiana TaxID=1069815 RepID=A0ABD3UE48_SINWO